MKTFSMFFSEDAGEKFNKMSDDQFADWKKKNPGAASKADELRKKAAGAAAKSSAPAVGKDKELPTSAITKPGASSSYKKVLADKAKQLAGDAAKKAGGALVKTGKDKINSAIRKSEMGKWAQGAKNAPKKDQEPDMPELDSLLNDIKNEPKEKPGYMSSPDDQNTSTAASRRREREDKRNRELEAEKFKRGQKLKKKVGAVGKYIANQMRSTVKDGPGVSYGSQQSGLRQR